MKSSFLNDQIRLKLPWMAASATLDAMFLTLKKKQKTHLLSDTTDTLESFNVNFSIAFRRLSYSD